MRTLTILLALAAAFAVPLRAQANPDSIKRRNDCRLAEQILLTGHPAPHLAWARGYMGWCDQAVHARVVSARILQVRQSADTSVLNIEWGPTRWLKDRTLFETALTIAGDRTAAPPARVYAFLALARLAQPRIAFEYEQLVGGFDEYGLVRGGCWAGEHAGDIYIGQGAPLPADFVQQIDQLGTRIRDDAGAPVDVRTAASCTVAPFQHMRPRRPGRKQGDTSARGSAEERV